MNTWLIQFRIYAEYIVAAQDEANAAPDRNWMETACRVALMTMRIFAAIPGHAPTLQLARDAHLAVLRPRPRRRWRCCQII